MPDERPNRREEPEITVPASFVGRTMAELDIRKRFATTVLLVKRRSGATQEVVSLVPDAKFVLREGDVMLVLGSSDDLQRLERTG